MLNYKLIVYSVPTLLVGLKLTVVLAVLSYVIALFLGTLLTVGRLSKSCVLRLFCATYVDLFRGTPLIVQLFMVYFGVPSLIQSLGVTFRFDRFYAAVMTLSLYISAYISEDLRSGVMSVGAGQWDAARALGLHAPHVWISVILPQAFRRALPSLGNEAIGIVKDTSLVAVIGYEELFRKGQLIVAETYKPFEIYAIVSLIYLIVTYVISHINRTIAKKVVI